MDDLQQLVQKLQNTRHLEKEEWAALIRGRTDILAEYVFSLARKERHQYYGHDVYIRGLIEFTNYCKNDCYYCGIRKSNAGVMRYRLDEEQILSCCSAGYALGFRTFVLQGGEDGWFTGERMVRIVGAIKSRFPDCAVTLSIGERSKESYQALFQAGADRYLLRHETFSAAHYSLLHPSSLTAASRQKCLWTLKDIGYQVGAGFMVGAPGQTPEYLAEDLLFLEKLKPHMVGIGPFIPHHATPFAGEPAGTLEETLFLLGLIRLLLPKVLLPATTALGTIAPNGRELGILSGANVIMPNLSPADVRENYTLYDNKLCTGAEAAAGIQELKDRMCAIGYQIVTDRGDSRM